MMLSKLSIGLLALASLFGLSKPANAQGYWNSHGHVPYSSPYYTPYYHTPYYPYYGNPYGYRYPYNPYSPGLGFGFGSGYGHGFQGGTATVLVADFMEEVDVGNAQ